MMRLFLLLLLCLSIAHAVERPQSPEQYLIDNALWPTSPAPSNTVAYQAKHEFPFYDSRVDTCPDAWPYDPQLIAAGMSGCYDLAPPNWANVSCSGSSGVHPTLSNVYIIRQSDHGPAYATADNSTYRWVLRCPGSTLGTAWSGTIDTSIDAAGVGLDAGELRIYDCLNADGSYTPMTPGVQRTGTADQCHVEQFFVRAPYVWVRSTYFEATSSEFGQPPCRVWGTVGYTQNFYGGCDNSDFYLGGQTAPGTGYNTLGGGFTLDDAGMGWIQNSRIVDCVAIRGVDGDGPTFFGDLHRYGRMVNLEIVNCPRIFTGTSNPPAGLNGEGNVIENIFFKLDGTRNFGDANTDPSPYASSLDWSYWGARYSSGDKIPYGRIAGEPPSYVIAAAASDAQVDAAFNCDTDKTSVNCPWTCSENQGISYKHGSNIGNEEQLARRAFVYGFRPNRIDANNPIWTHRESIGSSVVSSSPSCGGSSGGDSGSSIIGGQFNIYNVRHDLMVAEGYMNGGWGGVTGGSGAESFGVTITNSMQIMSFQPWTDNAYMDEWSMAMFFETVKQTIPGETAYLSSWGNTFATQGYVGESVRPTRNWWGSVGGGNYADECNAYIDVENSSPGNTPVAVNYVGLFGASVPPTNATNTSPGSGTHSTAGLTDFVHIERPYTAIANNSVPSVKVWSGVVPPEGSPVEGLCVVAAP